MLFVPSVREQRWLLLSFITCSWTNEKLLLVLECSWSKSEVNFLVSVVLNHKETEQKATWSLLEGEMLDPEVSHQSWWEQAVTLLAFSMEKLALS